MERLIKQVTESLEKAGLVEVEVSARHVHLTAEDVEALFGKGAVLHPKRPLSQKGQFLSEERVTLVGKKRKMERVAVLGPVRRDTQVELSVSDCVALGVEAPLRESGDVEGTGPIIIEGPVEVSRYPRALWWLTITFMFPPRRQPGWDLRIRNGFQ